MLAVVGLVVPHTWMVVDVMAVYAKSLWANIWPGVSDLLVQTCVFHPTCSRQIENKKSIGKNPRSFTLQ